MSKRRTEASPIDASIGYAVGPAGNGVAYARLTGQPGEHLLRVSFNVRNPARLAEREAGYAALTAVAKTLRGRGVKRARFGVDDPSLIDDVCAHRDLPPPMVIPYVRLRCALNQFDDFQLEWAAPSDLAQRARAEVALNIAA